MSTAAEPRTRAATGHLLAYGTGSLGMGVWVTVPGLLLLYFLTNTLGVPPLLAGFTLLVPKVIDAVVHPMLGTLSDREARRVGHRRGLMRVGLLLALALVAMFTVPSGLEGWTAALWVGLFYVVGNLLFACFQVPYLTTPSDLRVGYHERTRVFMVRMLVLTVGLLVAGVVAPAMVKSGERLAYTEMAVALGVLMVASGVVALRGVRRLTETCGFRSPDAEQHSTRADVRLAWQDRDFRLLVISYLLTGTTTHLVLAAVPFYAAYVLDSEGLTAVLMGAFLGPAVVAGPLWLKVSRAVGKQRGLLVAQAMFVAGCAALLVAHQAGTAVTVAVVVVLGLAFAGLQLLAFSMVPDAVAAAEERGTSRAGAYTGVWTATEAVGTAIGPYVYSAVLAIGGFVSATDGDLLPQTGRALDAVLLGFTVVPVVLMAAAFAVQRRCRLDVGPPPA
ncbi:MFS transporter [Aeromicrobium massiliense]|uniref:MFS transporter n=1 Tax=Aeromicrobium massiliense TaxID=1464554 RepID=UPI00057888F9|nr:MFS transporter [Aeromicrobium massiliense]